jgi:aryl-alcohol dehydrogenase-like predicted oxidoreductase
MEYTHLGRSGLRVSRLVLGTMNFGPETDEPTSHAIMDKALDYGINIFDTANVYGWGENRGRTETIIGSWFAKGGERRDKTVLATKLNGMMGDRWPNRDKLSALNIRRACDASLARLQTDHIDLYQMHHVDRDNEAAARRHSYGLVSEQSIYNLLTREVELEVLPAAEAYGLGVIPWSPLHGGLLGGVLRKEREGSRRVAPRQQPVVDKHRDQLGAYEDLCEELGEEPATVALAWLLTRPAVTGPIIGPRTIEQLDGAQRALELTLEEKVLDRLDEIFPGYQTAPEHYAW